MLPRLGSLSTTAAQSKTGQPYFLIERAQAQKWGEIPSYLQNSNSTFFLITVMIIDNTRRPHLSTYYILIQKQPKHVPLQFSSA